ncbi:MAG: nucleoside-diphosphate sugar epimerase [Candidatus Omnitrophica bacterium CG11_big_fil_rev_8_21_14_0_20_42_13]|uniref:UDP-glucuronate decarboxylase n=1 Tax=Candidatus Ghiorseimicrobium undicola TaxID=1974746 RepID=A0A2H0LY88_9BACT|nr:MAG: nucleoside-diphosphate sugar epimerase [Candidatus Omnitrophica bacterium CG11_big_fil_rev_8_21_14_0_20_42_13]
MKYLITGGAGFIGSHLADSLIAKNNKVIILDNLSTGRYGNLAHLTHNPGFKFVEGNILDEKLVDKLVDEADGVFHLAAAVGVDLIVKKPLESMTTNIKGSEVVLEAAHRYRKKILITSTSEIYGKNVNGPLKEEDDRILGSPLKSRWSYSTAKAVDEILAYIYCKEKGLPTVIVRLFNTVGPRQTGAYGMVIPRFVSQALSNKDITVYGDGKQSRCFLHVRDVVEALVKLINTEEAVGEVFNIGSQEEITIKDLAERIIKTTGSNSGLIFIPYDKAYEKGFEDMQRRVPDIKKINKLIGFKPTVDLNEIIKSVVAHIKQDSR